MDVRYSFLIRYTNYRYYHGQLVHLMSPRIFLIDYFFILLQKISITIEDKQKLFGINGLCTGAFFDRSYSLSVVMLTHNYVVNE